MFYISTLVFFIVVFSNSAFAGIGNHLILKNDFNRDGKADRIIFASNGISGFFQSTKANSKIDTIFLKQGHRTIYYTSAADLGGPYLKITESAGFFTVVSLMKPKKNKFVHLASYSLPSKTYFSDDPFADPFASPLSKDDICVSTDVFSNKATKKTLTWAEAISTHSVEESIKKAISPDCKKILGDEYTKMEDQIISACSISSGKTEDNGLVSCLDGNEETRRLAGRYKTLLAENLFNSEFTITCAKSQSSLPLASFDTSSKKISIFQVTPQKKDRSYKADFFHEMLHNSGVNTNSDVEKLVNSCILSQEKKQTRYHIPSVLTFKGEEAAKKDGVAINVPSQVKEIPSTSIASAVNEGAKTLDSNYSMENAAQFRALSNASKATFKSFEPLMAAAYNAAVPTAFAQNTIASSSNTTAVAIPTSKSAGGSRGIASAAVAAIPNSVASGAVYDVSSLPSSVPTSDRGELGNGMTVKASPVSFGDVSPRGPASSGGTETAASGSASVGGRSIAGSLASIKTTDRPDLRNNVPHLRAEEDFLKTLTTGKYAEVKAKLIDPKNQRILEEKRIQYVARDKTLGSKQPAIILKDLGNKFTVLRVNIE